jgi:signal recognition particle GTPase
MASSETDVAEEIVKKIKKKKKKKIEEKEDERVVAEMRAILKEQDHQENEEANRITRKRAVFSTGTQGEGKIGG